MGIKIKFLFISIVLICSSSIIFCQQNKVKGDEITRILQNFKNYRFGTISIYEVKNTDELKEIVESKKKSKKNQATAGATKECLTQIDNNVRIRIRNGVQGEKTSSSIMNELLADGIVLDPDVYTCVYEHYKDSLSGPGIETVLRSYLVTNRPAKFGQKPDTIIALIIVENEFENDISRISANLKTVGDEQIYSINTLLDDSKDSRATIDETKYGFKTLYGLLMSYIIQGNVENKTLEANGLTGDGVLLPPSKGNTEPLLGTGGSFSNEQIQKILRISDGTPEDIYLKTNEVIVSLDLIRWTHFQQRFLTDRRGNIRLDSNKIPLLDDTKAVNDLLPQYGVELKYGIDEIIYPSLWSERVTLSALWESVKLGVILPTNGWSSLATDFSQERKLTNAGAGIAATIDFPMEIIPKTGLFHFSFGYVVGDAKETDYKNYNIMNSGFEPNDVNSDWLIRFHGQFHYSIALSVDKDYLFRFGLGATMYNVECWQKILSRNEFGDTLTNQGKPVYGYKNVNNSEIESKNKTIGGLSGSMEFMAKGSSTPYGITFQYFDEALSGNLWLQIPIIKNTFSLRAEINGYAPVMRKEIHPWENNSIVIPMLRAIIIF